MKNKILAVCFALPFVCLLGWTVYLACQRAQGAEVKVAVRGYDPRDLLSGHYIQYEIDWERTDCRQFAKGKCPKRHFCKEARWGRQCRFYIPEEYAPQLDELFRARNNDSLRFEVVYSYIPGKPALAKQLLINNRDWKEFIDSKKAG